MGVEEAELAAACFALEVALRMGYNNLLLEGNAQLPIFALYDDLHVLKSCFSGFSCSAIRRSGNTVAHTIARWETGIANERICMEPLPSGLVALVDLDLI